jgi:hypothetical protein
MIATGHDPLSGGRKFREIAEEMCGKEVGYDWSEPGGRRNI